MLNINQIYNEDCLSGMKKLPDGSIDFIFSDLPYGITNNSWDIPIPLDTIWKEFERIIKDNGCIALWSQSPFDKTLACSNLQLYRYEWIIKISQRCPEIFLGYTKEQNPQYTEADCSM